MRKMASLFQITIDHGVILRVIHGGRHRVRDILGHPKGKGGRRVKHYADFLAKADGTSEKDGAKLG